MHMIFIEQSKKNFSISKNIKIKEITCYIWSIILNNQQQNLHILYDTINDNNQMYKVCMQIDTIPLFMHQLHIFLY